MRWYLILPKYVTGFFAEDTGESIPLAVDPKVFKAACHAAALTVHAQVVSIETIPHPGRNFHIAQIQSPSLLLWILCNARFPFIAFTSENPTWYSHPFIDVPPVASVFIQTHAFEVLPHDVLEAPPTPPALSQLAPIEHKYVRSWKSRRIGDIVFNHWD